MMIAAGKLQKSESFRKIRIVTRYTDGWAIPYIL